MPRKLFTEEQIALALRQHEGGAQIAEIIRKLGVTEQTFYRWKKKFAGLGVAGLRRLRQLEEENKKLKALVTHTYVPQASRSFAIVIANRHGIDENQAASACLRKLGAKHMGTPKVEA